MAIKARNEKPVVVAGGGIGGLAAALGLAQRGFRVTVLEQAHEFGEIGAGIQLGPNAFHVFDALGVGALVKKNAVMMDRIQLIDGLTEERIIDIPTGRAFRSRFGNPYAVIHRADIHSAMLEGCRRSPLVELHTHSKVTGFRHENNGVSVDVAGRERIHALALVGADGLRSAVRQQIVGDGEPPVSGHMCYRAVLNLGDMPKDLRWPAATLWAGPNTHIVHYPLRGWKLFNLVATVVRDTEIAAHNEQASPKEVLPLFEHNCDKIMSLMRVPKVFRRWNLRFREPVGNWTQGSVTLLGDAAHPMIQYYAQGACMAMEDGVCLAVMAERNNGDFAKAFKEYQDLRLARTARVQLSAQMLGRIYHAGGVERLVRNDMYRGQKPQSYYDALEWIYQAPDYIVSAKLKPKPKRKAAKKAASTKAAVKKAAKPAVKKKAAKRPAR